DAEHGEAADDGEHQHHFDQGEAAPVMDPSRVPIHSAIFCRERLLTARRENTYQRLPPVRDEVRGKYCIISKSLMNSIDRGVEPRAPVRLSVRKRKLGDESRGVHTRQSDGAGLHVAPTLADDVVEDGPVVRRLL